MPGNDYLKAADEIAYRARHGLDPIGYQHPSAIAAGENCASSTGSAPTDAELLNWIEHNLLRVEWSRDWPGLASWAVVRLQPEPYDFVSRHVLGRGDTIRAAIIEAMGPND